MPNWNPDRDHGAPPEGVVSEIVRAGDDALDARIALARVSPVVFNNLVLRDELTQSPIEAAPLHWRMHAVLHGHRRVIIIAAVDSGKSQQLTIGRVTWEIGQRTLPTSPTPTMRSLLVSKKMEGGADKFSGTIRRLIEGDGIIHRVFPRLEPGQPWTDRAFRVKGHPEGAKDYTCEAVGLDGSVMGARHDLQVFDDILDDENTRTDHRMATVTRWIRRNCMNRLVNHPEHPGRAWMIVNPWDEDDAAHTFGRERGWHVVRMPLIDDDGTLLWPDRWTLPMLERFRLDNGDEEADRCLRAITPSKKGRAFSERGIRECSRNGLGLPLRVEEVDPEFFATLPPGSWIECGVDLASSKKVNADETCFFVTLVTYRDGERNRLRPLYIERGKFSPPELRARFLDLHRRFNCRFVVEDNGAQGYVRDDILIGLPELTVEGFHTNSEKWSRVYGLGGLASDFDLGLWELPCVVAEGSDPDNPTYEYDPEVEAWIGHLRRLQRDERRQKRHTPDAVMASWFVREASRRFGMYRIAGFEDPALPDPLAPLDPSDKDTQAVLAAAAKPTETAAKYVWDNVFGEIDW